MRRSNVLWKLREGPVGVRPREGACEGSLGAADRTRTQVDSAGSPPLLGQKHVSALCKRDAVSVQIRWYREECLRPVVRAKVFCLSAGVSRLFMQLV